MPTHPNSEGCRIQCGKCNEIVASKDIVAHTKDRCSGRMIACPHCKLSFAFRDTSKHQEYCGSRTEACDLCKRYIKLRDMEAHVESSCTFPLVESKPAARASPPPDSGAASRMNLLSSMLESGSNLDPSIMAALLAQSVDFEDPLAAAANRSASSAATSSAQRQARDAREKLSRAMDAADRSESDDEDRRRSAARHAPKPKPAARASSIRRSPPPSAAAPAPSARALSVSRAAAAPAFACAYCQDRCASLESLQVHILTECCDAHSTMEQIDPAGAAKALAGQAKAVDQEHVSLKIPVAKPVARPTAGIELLAAIRSVRCQLEAAASQRE
jgi:hypothetical protein